MVDILAIDGPASSGKSSIARKLSIEYDVPLLMSGKLYRAVALKMMEMKVRQNNKKEILTIARSINDDLLNSTKLFSNNVSKLASIIASKKYLREALIEYQLNFPKKKGRNKKFVIVEGRDIGSVIFPKAKYKLFLWADQKTRARRRFNQVTKNGRKDSFYNVYQEIGLRDKKDIFRKEAPLRPDVNSVLLDTSNLDIEQSLKIIKKLLIN